MSAPKYSSEIAVGIIVTLLGTVLVRYTDLPTRVTIVETQQKNLDASLERIEGKLDRALLRLHR